jgi:diguanylate cyclase (GGDEF)-like protein
MQVDRPRAIEALQRRALNALGADRRQRLQMIQWLSAGTVYLGAGAVMYQGVAASWVAEKAFVGWALSVLAGLLCALAAIRSGWSMRFRDPAMSEWQSVMGCIAVDWACLMCGPMRTVALFPLLLVLTFAALTLDRRGVVRAGVFAMLSLGLAIATIHVFPSLRGTPGAVPLVEDTLNFEMMLVLLPAMGVMAMRLASMRARLRAQRNELRGQLSEAQDIASHDELTGLPNRRLLRERLRWLESASERSGKGFAIALIDLDHFKKINDALGHEGGDQYLKEFAAAAVSVVRDRDVVGRWGGEEFLLLLDNADAGNAVLVLERLQVRAAEVRVLVRPLTFSAGIAVFVPGDTVRAVIAWADEAMYEAKRAGRNRVVVARRA